MTRLFDTFPVHAACDATNLVVAKHQWEIRKVSLKYKRCFLMATLSNVLSIVSSLSINTVSLFLSVCNITRVQRDAIKFCRHIFIWHIYCLGFWLYGVKRWNVQRDESHSTVMSEAVRLELRPHLFPHRGSYREWAFGMFLSIDCYMKWRQKS